VPSGRGEHGQQDCLKHPQLQIASSPFVNAPYYRIPHRFDDATLRRKGAKENFEMLANNAKGGVIASPHRMEEAETTSVKREQLG
jgi:hypothetical protein